VFAQNIKPERPGGIGIIEKEVSPSTCEGMRRQIQSVRRASKKERAMMRP